jgi:hypothetical protein
MPFDNPLNFPNSFKHRDSNKRQKAFQCHIIAINGLITVLAICKTRTSMDQTSTQFIQSNIVKIVKIGLRVYDITNKKNAQLFVATAISEALAF